MPLFKKHHLIFIIIIIFYLFCVFSSVQASRYVANTTGIPSSRYECGSLRASSPERSCGGAEKRRASNYISWIWIPFRRLSFQISANQREAETSANVWTNFEENVSRVMTSLLMSCPPISILHQLFWCTYSNSRDVVASRLFPLPAPPPKSPGELARWLRVWNINLLPQKRVNVALKATAETLRNKILRSPNAEYHYILLFYIK